MPTNWSFALLATLGFIGALVAARAQARPKKQAPPHHQPRSAGVSVPPPIESLTPSAYKQWVTTNVDARKGEALSEFRHQIVQSYASRRDWSGLVKFFRTAFDEAISEEARDYIGSCIGELDQFKAGVAQGLREATTRAAANSSYRAIYFEYFRDGGDGPEANFFLCRDYSTDPNSDWAARFDPDGVILGSIDLSFLNCDIEPPLVPDARQMAEDYAYAAMLGAFGSILDRIGSAGLPFGFAEHGHSIVHVAPGV